MSTPAAATRRVVGAGVLLLALGGLGVGCAADVQPTRASSIATDPANDPDAAPSAIPQAR